MRQPPLLVVGPGHQLCWWLTGLWLDGAGNCPVPVRRVATPSDQVTAGPDDPQRTYNLRRLPRTAGPAAHSSPERTTPHPPPPTVRVTPAPPTSFPCPDCHRTFVTKVGLGVHRSSAHPAIANEEIELPAVKRRWGDEELRLMAREEALAVQHGVRFVNQHLATLVPGRTLEAIKGVRRGQKYRTLVEAAMRDIEASAHSISGDSATDAAAVTPPSSPAGASVSSLSRHGEPTTPPCSPPASESLLGHLVPDIPSAIRGLIPVVRNIRGWESDTLSQLAQECLEGEQVGDRITSWLTSAFPPHGRIDHRPAPRHRQGRRTGRKAQRRREYARTQRIFRSNMSWAAREILDATGNMGDAVPGVQQMAAHWGPYISQASKPAPPGPTTRPKPELAYLWYPVSCEEVTGATMSLGSAPGPDGIDVRQWRALPSSLRALLYNVVLLTGGFPPTLLTSRTVFVPKKDGLPETPADYRPISITSVVVRQLHKILSSRLRASGVIDLRQRCMDDGCAENISALAAVIYESRSKLRELHVASLDVAKAFDSVSHFAVERVLTNVGLPHGMIKYITRLYSNSSTTFEVRGERSQLYRIGRGVRQGDPLSMGLFCLVVDSIMGGIPPDVGFQLGGCRLNALAYADDILLFTASEWGMQASLRVIEERAGEYGLELNARKCSVLSMVPAGKQKKIKVVTRPTFQLGQGTFIPQLTTEAEWRYLGVRFSAAGPKKVKVELQLYLDRITRAPLKPQQRLKLLRCFLLPRVYHVLMLARATLGKLRALDLSTRAAVRRWLRLPKDTPAAFVHAPVAGGGLGIPSLATTVPGLMRQRLLSLGRSQSPVIRAVAESPWVERRLQWAVRALTRDGLLLSSKHLRDKWWNHRLHVSADGYELRECARSPLSSRWVDADSLSIPGRDYVQHVHVRINALPTRVRTTRGMRRLGQATQCRAGCQSSETAAHVIQGCFRTHGGRVLRHNAVCKTLASGLNKIGWTSYTEPVFHTAEGKRKPDIVCVKGERASVIDVQIVSGVPHLDDSHERKVAYYARNPTLVEGISARYGVGREHISFSSCTLSWRGIWSSRSADWLLGMGLASGLLRGITTRVLQGSHTNWTRWNRMTTRGPPVSWERDGVG